MAQNGTKNGKYAVQGIETLRAKINREFIIRLSKNGKSQLVGFTRLCLIVGDLHAEHYAKKAICSKQQAPTFVRGGVERLCVTFSPR